MCTCGKVRLEGQEEYERECKWEKERGVTDSPDRVVLWHFILPLEPSAHVDVL